MKIESVLNNRYSLVIFFLLLLLTIASGIVPVNDIDFFWHLKTGEWIWQNKSLPDKDPFAFTTLPADSAEPHRTQTILKSYWLSQLFFYGLYSLAGFKGIIVFRILIFCIILLIIWRKMKKDSVDNMLIILFSIPYIFIVREYQTERPQLFSFLFAVIVICLLEDLKNSLNSLNGLNRFKLISLPLVMLLWANMHGGFLIGNAFIALYLFTEWLVYLLPKRHILNAEPYKKAPLRFTLIAVVSVIATFLTPSTYHPVYTMFSVFSVFKGSLPQELVTLEHWSPLRLYAELSPNWYAFWSMLGLSFLVIVLRFKKFNLAELFLLIGTIAASLSAVRNSFFFFVAAMLIIARHANSFITDFSTSIPDSVKSYALRAVRCMFMVLLVVLIYRMPTWRNISFKEELLAANYPIGAVSFIEKYKPSGPMFNYVNWGGYLIWKLYPEYKIFIDTRTLNTEVFRQYLSVVNANQESYLGMPEWKGILKGYGINLILTPLIERYNGDILPYIKELMRDDEWAIVYMDGHAAIFLRVSPSTEELVRKHYFDKSKLWYEMDRR